MSTECIVFLGNPDELSQELKEKIEMMGRISWAGSSAEVIKILKNVKAILLLICGAEPHSRYDICAHVRESQRTRDIPIAVLSYEDKKPVKAEAFDRGVDAFITLPCKSETAIARLYGLICRKSRVTSRLAVEA